MSQTLCEACGKPIPPDFCTMNICPECCEKGRCPQEQWCAYKKAKKHEA